MKNPTSCPANLLRSRKSLYLAIAAASQLIASAQVIAGPEGGKIVGGRGAINQSGLNTRIEQHTDRMAVDWQSFNVGVNERVEFHQPGVSSIALNRILSHSGSEIHGQIESNGQIILVNPNGVFFGENSRINVGGMIASGLQINPDDFMNGEFTLSAVDGTEGKVINAGIINAATGGSVTLAGQQVNNEGLISAKLGSVNLAAGKEAVVTFEPDGLVGVKISKAILQDELGIDAAVVNSGEINAEGGRILLTASVSQDIFSQAVNSDGVGEARSVVMHQDGSFTLGAGADVINTGALSVSTETGNAGRIVAIGENVTHSGSVTADSKNGNGGSIELHGVNKTEIREQGAVSAQSVIQGRGGDIKILGNKVGIFDQSSVSASGANGGGEILIGGDKTGANPLVRNAEFIFLDSDVSVAADGILNGDGGRLITFASDTARIHGRLSVHGGVYGGNGGFIETSGLKGFAITSAPDISSGKGVGGKWLIDPYSLTITPGFELNEVNDSSPYISSGANAEIGWGEILDALQSGDVIIQTGDADGVDGGDIIFATDAVFGSGNNTRTLELIAHRDIKTEGFDIRASGNNRLNLVFNAGRDINISGDSVVATNGGNFTATSLNFNLGGSLSTPSINTNGGDVLINSIGAGGDVQIYGSVTTNGGSFTVGNGVAPANFYSAFDGSLFGVIDTFSNSGYGSISIDVTGDARLGQLRSDSATGNPNSNTSDVIVQAGNNIILDREFNFDSSVRHSNNYQNGAPLLSLSAGNNITINQRIFDASDAQGGQSYYDTLNIELTAGTADGSQGLIDINADIYTAGGNFEAEGKIFNSADGLINTDYGKETVNSSSTTGGHIILNMSDSVTLGGLITESGESCGGSYCGNLDITSGGTIQGSAQLTINGSTTLNSGVANITLNNANNQFGEAVSIESAGTVTLRDGSGEVFELDDSNITGALTLTASSGIRSVGDIIVGGEARFNAGSQNVELNSNGNDFSSVVFSTTGAVSVRDVNDIALESSGTLGSLIVNAAGAITNPTALQSLRVSGLTELSAGAASDITLDSASNNFNNVLVTRARNVSLRDSNAITLGQDGRNFSFSNNLTVNAGGNITQAGNALEVSGLTSLQGAVITLNNQQNDFNTLTISSAQSANIEDRNNINLGNITLTGTGNNSLYINADNIVQLAGTVLENQNGGGVELYADGYITVENIDTSGRAGTDSAGGAGGRVLLNATRLNVGTIDTSGGDAQSALPDTVFDGGLAGTIELLSQGSGSREIVLSGDLIAEGGAGVNGGTSQAQATINVRLQDSGNIRLQHASFFTSDINISGNGGSDTLYGFNLPGTWTITEQNAGNITGTSGGTLRFSGIEQIRGGNEADTFNINHNIANGIYGGGGNDIFNLNAIQLTGNLFGEAGDDEFIVTTMPSGNVQINGGDVDTENDTLAGPNASNQWRFTGAASGTLNERVSFSSIEDIVGGDLDDTFSDVDNYSTDHSINAGDGNDTVLVDNEVTLNFSADIGGIFNGVINAEIIRSESADGGTLTVNSTANMVIDWFIQNIAGTTDTDNEGRIRYVNNGTTRSIDFTNFAHLIGGDGNDIFNFSGNSTITGSINGGDGSNRVDISGAARAHQVGFGSSGGDASIHLTNIQRVVGNDYEGTRLIIASGNNTWNITDFDAGGTVANGVNDGLIINANLNVEFVNFHSLVGGSGEDHFNFASENPGSITGSVNGGGGTNNSITGRNASNVWTIDAVNGVSIEAGLDEYLTASSNIQHLQGGSGQDIFEINAELSSIRGGEGNDRFELGTAGRVAILDGQLGEDTLVGRNANNLWNINDRDLAINGGANYVNEFLGMEILQGGTAADEFIINTNFAGTLIGGAGDDTFRFYNNGSVALLDGGTHVAGDIIDLTNASNNLSVALDATTEADINAVNIEQADANSNASHTLIALSSRANNWSIEGQNQGILNNAFRFSGFANLMGGALTDVFVFANNNASITGVINGGNGTGVDVLDLVARTDDSVVQVLESGDSAITGRTNIVGIEEVAANQNATNTLFASNRENLWQISGPNTGTLNRTDTEVGLEFTNFHNVVGGALDDRFSFIGSGSLDGTVDGGAHINGDSVDKSQAVDADVRLADVSGAGSGFIRIEEYIGNDTTSTLYGGDVANIWNLRAGVNQITIGDPDAPGIVFIGFANLQGGSRRDTFNINEGTLTGSIRGGGDNDIFSVGGGTVQGGIFGDAGEDTLTATIGAGAVGGINFNGGDGVDQLIVTGGNENYNALHNTTDVGGELIYTDAAGNNYTVSFEQVGQINDNLRAALLMVNGTSADDIFTLTNNRYRLNGLTEINYTNKNNLTIAASSADQINLEGTVNVANTLTLRNARVTANASGLINANSLRLDGTAQVGSADNRLITNVNSLFVTAATGGVYLQEQNALDVAELSSSSLVDLRLGGNLTSSTPLIFSRDFIVNTTGGDILLSGNNQLTGNLSFASNGLVELRNASATNLANIQAQNLTVDSNGTITGTGALVVSSLAQFTTANNLTLTNVNNNFNSVRINAASSADVRDSSGLSIEGANATGTVNLTAQGISLNNVNVNTLNINAAEEVLLGTAITTTANMSINSEGLVTQQSNLLSETGNITINARQFTMNNGAQLTTTVGDINVNTGGDFIARTINAAGDVNLDVGGNTQFNDVIRSSGAVNLIGEGSINLANTVTGATGVSLQSRNGGIQQQGQLVVQEGDLSLIAAGDITMNSNAVATANRGNISYTGSSIVATSFIAETGTVTLAATRGAITDNNGNNTNVTANRLVADAITGIGADNRLETMVSELSLSNNTGLVDLENGKSVTINRLHSNGDVVLNNLAGDITLDNTSGTLYDRSQTDARLAGGTANANYEIGTLTINVANGNLLGSIDPGPNIQNPDIVARTAVLTTPAGSIGSPDRMLVLYVKDYLFIGGARSWGPLWGFDTRPTTVDNQATIQGSLSDLLASGNEQLVEVETLDEVDPAVFTNVRNYFYDDIAILLPRDQQYFDDEEE
ncbi:filamentous hemagglutinin N-terminal domain-containing protein [Cellvibrio sp. ARAG 10.3]|uniref:filamentous hemagglutinin N-terminal domain-containing protein n=1 Tax=Cellvibrio sp. ARAG 10.3 TaxID=3451358 RepID=UPI003F4697DA